MKKNNTLRAVYSALFAALIFAGSQFIKIPLPFGYFNLGDCFILISAIAIGGYYAMLSSAIGAVLADILSGYALYAPATFVIKALMVAVMLFILRLSSTKNRLATFTIGAMVAELIMVIGYFIYDTVIYSFTGAVACLPGNALQGVAAVITSNIILAMFEKSGLLSSIKNRI